MTEQRPMFPPRRDNPFRIVGGIEADATPAKPAKIRNPVPPEADEQLPRRHHWRDREVVKRDIEKHIEAARAYRIGVAWLVAAEEQNLPQANIEAALGDVRKLYAEMVEAARCLVVVMPTDLKALCDLTMYLEKNFSILPAEVVVADGGGHGGYPRTESLAFHLLRTVRLSLRALAKYGKHSEYADD